MKASQSPDQVGRINAYYFSIRETILDQLQNFFIFIAIEYRNDHGMIGNIKISIRGGQALFLTDHFIRHRYLDNIQLFSVQQTHCFQLPQVLLKKLIVPVIFIFFNNGNDGILVYKTGSIVNMAVRIISDNSLVNPKDL